MEFLLIPLPRPPLLKPPKSCTLPLGIEPTSRRFSSYFQIHGPTARNTNHPPLWPLAGPTSFSRRLGAPDGTFLTPECMQGVVTKGSTPNCWPTSSVAAIPLCSHHQVSRFYYCKVVHVNIYFWPSILFTAFLQNPVSTYSST